MSSSKMSETMLRATDHVFTAPWAPKNGGRTTAFVYLGHLRAGLADYMARADWLSVT